MNTQLLRGARGRPEHAPAQGTRPERSCSFPGLARGLSPHTGCSPGRELRQASASRVCGGSVALSLPGISAGSEWRFQIPFPALAAVNSEAQGLPTEQISFSSIQPHSYGTAVPRRRSPSRVGTAAPHLSPSVWEAIPSTAAALPTSPCSAPGSSEVFEEEGQKGTGSAHVTQGRDELCGESHHLYTRQQAGQGQWVSETGGEIRKAGKGGFHAA